MSRATLMVAILPPFIVMSGRAPAQPPGPPVDIVVRVRRLLRMDQAAKYREALNLARLAVAEHPEEAAGHVALGEALRIAAQQYDLALASFQRAAELEPRSVEARYGIALCLEALDRRREAVTAWQKFLTLEPNTNRAWLARRGLTVVRLVPLPHDGAAPAWSPDGSRLVVSTGKGVWLLSGARTSVRTALPTTGHYYSSPTWSPDGRSIAFERRGPVGARVVCIVDALGKEAERVLLGNELSPYSVAWAPDGRRLAFQQGRERGIFLTDLQGNVSRPSFTRNRVQKVGVYPAWAPDGERLVYSAADDGKAYDLRLGRLEENAAPTLLYAGPGRDILPTFSPSDAVVVFASNDRDDVDGGYRLCAVDVRHPDGAKHPLGMPGCWSRFSPDGRWLAASPFAKPAPGRRTTLVQLGGLPPSQLYVEAAPVRRTVTVRMENLSRRSLEVTARYELFTARSIRVAQGARGDTLTIPPGGTVEWSVVDAALARGEVARAKITAVTGQGLRSVTLVDLRPRSAASTRRSE